MEDRDTHWLNTFARVLNHECLFIYLQKGNVMGQQSDNQQLHNVRHSLAHLLAATVVEMFPGAKNAIGPAVDDGFYQDFEMPEPVSEEDLPKIEARMREILKSWGHFERKEVDREEA